MQSNISSSWLLTLIILFGIGSGLNITPFFQLTNKYIETGTAIFDTNSYYTNTTADTNTLLTFTTTTTNTFASFRRISSIQSLGFDISSSGNINITTFICSPHPVNSINFCLQTMSFSRISTLSKRYIILESSFNKITHFYDTAYYFVQLQGTAAYNTTSPINSNFIIPPINTVGTTRLFIFLNGFNATASNSTYSFDFLVTPTYPTSSILSITTTSNNNQTIQVSSLMYSVIGYNQNDMLAWPFPSGKITFSTFSPTSVFTDPNNTFQTYNSFWGLYWINTTSSPVLNFNSLLTPTTSLSATTSIPTSSYGWNGLIFQFKDCNTTTPYYMQTQDNCYDICPGRYYQDNGQMLCLNCTMFDCLKCLSNGTCTTCDNGTDHRELNPSTGRCDPIAGYYSNGVAISLPCDPNCLTCIGANTSCTSCNTSLYLSTSNICLPCISNCQLCTNGTTCTNCTTGYILDIDSTCVIYRCSDIINCGVCNSTLGCNTCNMGYNLTNVTLCESICGDGIWVSGQECDDNNTIDGDGCSSTCLIQSAYYCNNTNLTTSTCDICTLNCLNCTSNIICTSCLTPSTVVTNLTGDFCLFSCTSITNCDTCQLSNSSIICDNCTLGYTLANNVCSTICGDGFILGTQECDDGNLVAGDGCSNNCTIQNGFACSTIVNTSACLPCIGATFQSLNKSICQTCVNYDCGTCDISGNCTSCNASSNRQMNTSQSRCLPLDGYFDDGVNFVAPPCDLNCLTCSGNSSLNCLSCKSGQVLNGTECPTCDQALGTGCSTCSFNGTSFVCSACTGSSLQGGVCVFTQPPLPQQPSNMMLIIILAAVGALLLCCCLLIFCCWRRRKNQENKVQQQAEKEVEVQKENEKKDPFDQKLLSSKKKYRGTPPVNPNKKSKRKRSVVPLPMETQENQLSMEQFKFNDRNKENPLMLVPKNDGEKIPLEFQDIDEEKPSEKHSVNDGFDEEKPSEKHEVNNGLEEVPPQPQREQINSPSQSRSSAIDTESDVSEGMGGGRGR